MKAYLSGDQTYTVRIGDQTEYKLYQATLDANLVYTTDTKVTSIASTSTTEIDSFSITQYRSSRSQIQITQGSNYQIADTLILHNGSTSSLIEYGSISTNDYLANFSTTVESGKCVLNISMLNSADATVKVVSQKLTV